MTADVTPEGAALTLLQMVAWAEDKTLKTVGGSAGAPSRDWILWTYAQCLQTVKNPMQVQDIAAWPIPK
jgi:hypothetical protein